MSQLEGKNAVERNIISRRTIKAFKKDPINVEEIIELLNVAKWAPNHKLTEPWRFQLYVDEGKETFVQAYIDSQPTVDGEVTKRVQNKAQYYRDIPIHLAVIMPEDPRQRRWDEDYGAVSSLIQNFQLAAWERGIGMIWRTNDWVYDPVFREGIGASPGEKVVATLMIGYPKHVPAAGLRTGIRELITIIDK
ncbi:nitroreductase family protein [Sporosarcina sp. G11-34]|uniref:nitroreductase family protein n=1 Tax=Sporosarcina sp. G11-34 TaxID=2849605 RepID=UPI0022A96C40|nr:nitroreductase [Sporosarcina sp. G11-34]MCZ2260339.1 nitroreductase [Sporosarcina sp. G11-34]